jgi:hypothetical protein
MFNKTEQTLEDKMKYLRKIQSKFEFHKSCGAVIEKLNESRISGVTFHSMPFNYYFNKTNINMEDFINTMKDSLRLSKVEADEAVKRLSRQNWGV